jgi:cephalosporin hydroxylase
LELIDNKYTDKNAGHTYIDDYEKLFSPIQKSATLVVEIGIQRGGSIKLWHDYFQNANIIGIDISPNTNQWLPGLENLESFERIQCLFNTDAYGEIAKSIKDADIIIDDGPHSLESFVKFIQKYSESVKVGGYLIIEDVQSIDWVPTIKQHVKSNFDFNLIDNREKKNRYDDMLIVMKRLN